MGGIPAGTNGAQIPAIPPGISPEVSVLLQPLWDAVTVMANQLGQINGVSGTFVFGARTVTINNGIVTGVV